KRKALGEEALGKRGAVQSRHLMSKRRMSGEDPYAWMEGRRTKKRMKKPGRAKKTKSIKQRRRYKVKAKPTPKKAKLPAKIGYSLKKVEKGAVLLPKEIMTAARTTGKVTGKITADVSRTIASGVVAGPKEARKIIRCVQEKIKAGHLKSKIDDLFAILGKECYRLLGKKRPVLKEKNIRNLIKEIKECHKQLQTIERKA
ncbi:hypothetical protein GTN66_06005, partial [bacterium]|nr:hypothetical protein [bacterium]NIO73950.1 hypothetical protein [bacterium]